MGEESDDLTQDIIITLRYSKITRKSFETAINVIPAALITEGQLN